MKLHFKWEIPMIAVNSDSSDQQISDQAQELEESLIIYQSVII